MPARRIRVRNHPHFRNQRPQRRCRLPPHLWRVQGASQVFDQLPVPRRQARMQPQGRGLRVVRDDRLQLAVWAGLLGGGEQRRTLLRPDLRCSPCGQNISRRELSGFWTSRSLRRWSLHISFVQISRRGRLIGGRTYWSRTGSGARCCGTSRCQHLMASPSNSLLCLMILSVEFSIVIASFCGWVCTTIKTASHHLLQEMRRPQFSVLRRGRCQITSRLIQLTVQ